MGNLVCVVFGILLSSSILFAQLSEQDPGHKAYETVLGTKFSVPNGFVVENVADQTLAFITEREYNLGEFVAVANTAPDRTYLSNLATSVALSFFPDEKPFRWRFVPSSSMLKKSRYQTMSGDIKGLNDSPGFLELSCVVLKISDHYVITGYATTLGNKTPRMKNAKYLYELDGPGGASMPGLYALAHIIASITGEKYSDINPGISLSIGPR